MYIEFSRFFFSKLDLENKKIKKYVTNLFHEYLVAVVYFTGFALYVGSFPLLLGKLKK